MAATSSTMPPAIQPQPILDEVGEAPAKRKSVESLNAPPVEVAQVDAHVLTPLRAHYLKKTLMQLQLARETDALTASYPNNVSALSYLGPPFTPPPRDAPLIDLPFLRYVFRQFILTFPFMAAAPRDFYSDKLQPFVTSILSRNLSPNMIFEDDTPGESPEGPTNSKVSAKLDRNLSIFLADAIKLVEPEEVVRLSQKDLDNLETLARKRQAKQARNAGLFEVNVVGVRTVVDKGRVRSKPHDEFFIRTRRSNFPDVFVARRYGDFRTFITELRKAHPQEYVPEPPTKDRTTISAPVTPLTPLSPPAASRSPEAPYSAASDTLLSPNLSEDSFTPTHPSRLVREKNRLTLRSYLHTLLGNKVLTSSPVLRSFLLSGPTVLTKEELEDARRREEADRVRENGRKRFAREIAARVDSLREAMKSVKGDVMGKDGLANVFATVKVTSDVRDLPQNYKAVLEWARVSMASTVFHHYVASDNASQTFVGLKRTHGLMPYFLLKSALKISNPIGMIRGVLDLFLAQPFGGHSLLQRMFTGSLMEEVKTLEEQIEAVMDKVEDPVICTKVRQFVYAPKAIQDRLRVEASAEGVSVLVTILRSSQSPVLNRAQMQRVVRAHRAHLAYLKEREDSDDDGPQDDDAWLFEDLMVLAKLYSRLRDCQQFIELIFEGVTADLLRDILTIFYTPLAQVYRAASIADSLGDMQNFVNDLIKTVEQVDELNEVDPHRTVNTFIDLIQRHEQSFYHFVHKVHSKGEKLFDGLMRWIELWLAVVREGLGPPLCLEFLLPHAGPERAAVMSELDAVTLYHYKLKVVHEDKVRRKFGRVSKNDADAEDEATRAMVDSVVGEISIGNLLKGDAIDFAAEETDDESEEEGDSSEDEEEEEESEESSSEGGHTSLPRPTRSQTLPLPAPLSHESADAQRQSLFRSNSIEALKRQNDKVGEHVQPPLLPPRGRGRRKHAVEVLKPPALEHIPNLLPIFIELMRPHLRPRQQ